MLSLFVKYRFIIVVLLTVLIFQACQYPYNTRQAREARKQAAITRRKDKENKLPLPMVSAADSLAKLAAKDTTSAKTKGGISKERGGLAKTDTSKVGRDSLAAIAKKDSIAKQNAPAKRVVTFASDSLSAPVTYDAADSLIYNVDSQTVSLYGTAHLIYQDMDIKAAIIVVDFKHHLATADCTYDSAGVRKGEPEFKNGEQAFTAKRIVYNYESKKGKLYEGATHEGEGYLHSGVAKFIGKSDEYNGNDVIFNKNSLYSTCDYPEAHFGIRAARSKVIPKRLIVVGPSYLEVAGIPTPLALPFGFFPITTGRHSGLILPKDVENSPTLGFGLRNVGYYFGMSDYWDLSLTGDIYTRGSWGVHATADYKTRYKYTGSLALNFTWQQYGDKETPDFSLRKDFNIRWQHRQEQGANPYNTFSGEVNLGTGSYYSHNFNDAQSVLQQTMLSRVNFTHQFPGKPMSLSVSASHNQDVKTHSITIEMPAVDFTLQRIYPFRRKKAVGKSRWYEEIAFNYSGTFKNRIQSKDTLLFSSHAGDELRKNLQFGVNHAPGIQMNFKVFKYINITPTVDYHERWYFYRSVMQFDPNLRIKSDTTFNADRTVILSIKQDTTFGKVDTIKQYGFYPVRDYQASLSMSTVLYGTSLFKMGPLKKIRHTLTPSISFAWRPDFAAKKYNYWDSIQTDSRYPYKKVAYDHYQGSQYIYGSAGSGRSALLNFSFSNVVEAKVYSKQDTINHEKKIKLLNNFTVQGTYNFLADSFKLSTITFSGNTQLFKKLNLNFGGTFDPYYHDGNDTRHNVSLWSAERKLARLTNARISLSTTFNGNDILDILDPANKKKTKGGENNGAVASVKNKFMLVQQTTLNYNLTVNRKFVSGRDTMILVQSLDMKGGLQFSENWSFNYNLSYDFVAKKIPYPTFEFARDLHCWQLGLNWEPSRQTWSFFLRAKGSSMSFLNIPAKKRPQDPF